MTVCPCCGGPAPADPPDLDRRPLVTVAARLAIEQAIDLVIARGDHGINAILGEIEPDSEAGRLFLSVYEAGARAGATAVIRQSGIAA
jgi:hypothetical protein